MPNDSPLDSPLTKWERLSVPILLSLMLAYGVITEIRSAFQSERKTDFGVYTTAGGAVRNGLDPYSIRDEHGWHYCYPPPFAIAMAVLAEPPVGFVPFAVSVGIWYVLSLLAIIYAVHVLAFAVRPDDRRGSRSWWLARSVPIWICLGGIGMTLGRGQVNLVVIAFIAMAIAANVGDTTGIITSALWVRPSRQIQPYPPQLLRSIPAA